MTSELLEIASQKPEAAPGAHDPARRKAAAYLDLWERQLIRVATEGVPPPRAGRGERP